MSKTQSDTPTRARRRRKWERGFIAALAETGNVSRAAKAAQIGRDAAYRLRGSDPDFARLWEEAEIEAAAMLEAEARRRAVDGLIRYKFTKTGDSIMHPRTGEPYYELEYSDALLVALLKAHMPERYRDNSRIEHAGKVDHQMEAMAQVDLSVLTSEELMRLAEIQDKLEGRVQ